MALLWWVLKGSVCTREDWTSPKKWKPQRASLCTESTFEAGKDMGGEQVHSLLLSFCVVSFFLSLWSPVKTQNWVNWVCCVPIGLMFCSEVTSPKPGLDVLKRFNYLLLLCTYTAGLKKKHKQFQPHCAEGCTNSRALTVRLCFLLRCLLPLSAPI